jgi:two-component system, LytTR family, response regulator
LTYHFQLSILVAIVYLLQMTKVLVHTTLTIEIMEANQLIRYEGYQNYIRVHIENCPPMISNEKLQDVVANLDSVFYQCHKSHVVNLDKVVRYHRSGHLELTNGDKVPVARRRKSTIEEELKKWIQRRVMQSKIEGEEIAEK